MAQKTIVQLIDDVSNEPIPEGQGETVTFTLDGVTYETDLNKKNAQALRDTFGKYIDNARKVSGSRTKRTSSKPKEDLNAIREWARSNGHNVSDRGRISQEIRDAYAAAN